MRKSIIPEECHVTISPDLAWLDLPTIARAEITSEEALHPIESALNPSGGPGWRASEPGRQTIRLYFDEPLRIRRIHLVFHEEERQRTHEFVLRWSPDNGRSYREIVRQQFNFSPPDTTQEVEDYAVDLACVTVLELIIAPDIGGANVHASLARLRIA